MGPVVFNMVFEMKGEGGQGGQGGGKMCGL